MNEFTIPINTIVQLIEMCNVQDKHVVLQRIHAHALIIDNSAIAIG